MSSPLNIALRTRLVRHMVEVVNDTPLEVHPFPHFCVQGFLPRDTYEQLLASFPPEEHYEAFAYEKHHHKDGESNRKRFQMKNAWLDKLPGDSRSFWYSVRSALGSEELKQAAFAKVTPGLTLRYRVADWQARDLPGFALPELFRETEGYSIAPHPDTRKKVVTMQIALAADKSQEPFGTEFYQRSLNPLSWLREPRGFETVKRMPFLPNTAYAFSVLNTLTLKSWHGRTAISGQLGVRNSLLNIWYEKAENSNTELAAERTMFRQAKAA